MGDDLRFDGRVAVVTGAGRGIGREEALLLAARGASVVVNDLGVDRVGGGADAEPAREVVAEIEAAGGTAVANLDDISTEDGAAALIAQAIDTYGAIDAVINNAGISGDFDSIDEMSFESFDRVIKVNLYGTWLVARAAWAPMRERGYGRIVNTISGAGCYGLDRATHYCSSKGGAYGLTRALAIEGRDAGINVNAISPGALTRMLGGLEEEVGAEFIAFAQIAMQTKYPAAGAVWLAHESCDWNGEVLWSVAGRMAKVFMAEGPGHWREGWELEDVAANLEPIREQEGYVEPPDCDEALAYNASQTHFELPAAGVSGRFTT